MWSWLLFIFVVIQLSGHSNNTHELLGDCRITLPPNSTQECHVLFEWPLNVCHLDLPRIDHIKWFLVYHCFSVNSRLCASLLFSTSMSFGYIGHIELCFCFIANVSVFSSCNNIVIIKFVRTFLYFYILRRICMS
jgi:hypothetical protein